MKHGEVRTLIHISISSWNWGFWRDWRRTTTLVCNGQGLGGLAGSIKWEHRSRTELCNIRIYQASFSWWDGICQKKTGSVFRLSLCAQKYCYLSVAGCWSVSQDETTNHTAWDGWNAEANNELQTSNKPPYRNDVELFFMVREEMRTKPSWKLGWSLTKFITREPCIPIFVGGVLTDWSCMMYNLLQSYL